MKKAIVAVFTSICLMGFGSVATAQSKGKPAKKQKAKVYDFTGDDIDGELIRPDGEGINVRGTASHTSLIKLRQDFIKEILKSVEDL